MPDENQTTPHLTPEQWQAMTKHDLWSNWSSLGHLHNLLDYWADDLLQERFERRMVERQFRGVLEQLHVAPAVIDALLNEAKKDRS